MSGNGGDPIATALHRTELELLTTQSSTGDVAELLPAGTSPTVTREALLEALGGSADIACRTAQHTGLRAWRKAGQAVEPVPHDDLIKLPTFD